ncbi:tail fiber protein [Ralstonia phage RPSC1]|uniref:Tail fibers protein n=1 Tax=Ralstonia phage RPSC1 TaxID=2041351 RepID=A0A2Z2U7S4_9CAUD|nr:tail fiber protein [Ralstonia phage RPSC1]ATN92938.1 tail fibers protein [Ralstonia phage RPSC1]
MDFEYLARKFVQVTLIGDTRRVLNFMTEFTFANATSVRTSQAWGPTQGFRTIEIRRVTSATERLVNFNDGSILRASDLNLAEVQTIHIAQEARDLAADTLGADDFGNLDARGRRIVNVGTPVQGSDAMTYGVYTSDRAGLLVFRNEAEGFRNEARDYAYQAGQYATQSQTYAGQSADSAFQAGQYRTEAGSYSNISRDYSIASGNSATAAAGSASAAAISAANAAAAAAPATELVNKVDNAVAKSNAAEATANAASAAVANKQDKLGFWPVEQTGATKLALTWGSDSFGGVMRGIVNGSDYGPIASTIRQNRWTDQQQYATTLWARHDAEERVRNTGSSGTERGGWGASSSECFLVMNAARSSWVLTLSNGGNLGITGDIKAGRDVQAGAAVRAPNITAAGEAGASGRIYLAWGGGDRYCTIDSSNMINWVDAAKSSNVGQLSNSGIWYGSEFVMGSDARLKDSWQPLTPSFVMDLAGVKAGSYRLKATGERSVGIEAQSLAKVMPEAVTANDKGILHVNVGGAAMAAVVYLAREVLRLSERVAALENSK